MLVGCLEALSIIKQYQHQQNRHCGTGLAYGLRRRGCTDVRIVMALARGPLLPHTYPNREIDFTTPKYIIVSPISLLG